MNTEQQFEEMLGVVKGAMESKRERYARTAMESFTRNWQFLGRYHKEGSVVRPDAARKLAKSAFAIADAMVKEGNK